MTADGLAGSIRRPPAPLLPAALGLVAGIVVDNSVAPGRQVYVWLSVIVLVLTLAGRRWPTFRQPGWLMTPLAAATLGGLLHDSSFRRVSRDHIVHYVSDPPRLARVSGTIVTPPRVAEPREHFFSRWTHSPPSFRFVLQAESMAGDARSVAVSGLVTIKVDGTAIDVQAGDYVTVLGTLYRLRPAGNPGQFDYAKWQRRKGVHVGLRCPGTELISVVSSKRDRMRALAERLRSAARSVVLDEGAAIGDEQSTLLETLVLGRRRAVDRRVEELFIRTGTAHFLAVSGFHVGVVGWFVWSIGRVLGGGKRRCALVVGVAILLYAGLVDPRPPVFRATIIGLVYCTSVLVRRPTSPANWTALAAVILLVGRPTMLFEAGFQLSFVGVLAICYLQPVAVRFWRRWIDGERVDEERLIEKERDASAIRRLGRRSYAKFRAFASLSIVACLASTPLVVLYFGHIAPLAPLHTIVVFPFVVVTLLLGLLTVVAGLAFPILIAPLTAALGWSTSGLLWVVELIHDVSPSFRGWPVVPFQLLYLALVLILVGSLQAGPTTVWGHVKVTMQSWMRSARKRVCILAAALLIVGLSAMAFLRSSDDPGLQVTVLAVGRGSSTVIEFPDGSVWLYDCGTNGSYDVGVGTIVPYCRVAGIDRIDRVLISHANLDHYSGLFSVIEAVSTERIVLNDHFEGHARDSRPAGAMLAELRRREYAIEPTGQRGQSDDVGGVAVETLWPPSALSGKWRANDTSTVVRLKYAGRSVLLCGDIEREAMAKLLEGGDLSADVLILPHHGSIESNTAAFVAAVNPSVCIASASKSLTPAGEGEPGRIAPEPWRGRLYNTADDGAVTVKISRGSVEIETFRSEQ